MKIRKIIYMLLLAAVPFAALYSGGGAAFPTGQPIAALEEYTAANIPFKEQLRGIGADIRLIGGKRENDGIFIGADSLVKNIEVTDMVQQASDKNTEAASELAEYFLSIGKQAYIALMPTASAIYVDAVPNYAETLNQREIIESAYGALTGKLTALDIYLPLYSNRTQYLYYRTENNLTAYGGYYVYSAMVKRMLGISEPGYNAFEISYANNEFYGDLSGAFPYNNPRADVIILFKYSRTPKQYLVTHYYAGGAKTYHTLFPEEAVESGGDMDIYLGGLSAVMDIRVPITGGRKLDLLVFGDKTALSYLPFLVNHYSRVTFVDLELYNPKDIRLGIQAANYDQILMAYSVETWVSSEDILSNAKVFMV